MKTLTLTVPYNQRSYSWFKFIQESLESPIEFERLIVDFNKVRFMETDDFVVLACLIESLVKDCREVTFTGGTDTFNAHLNNIRFKEYWTPNFNREKFTTSRNGTTLCLWKITREEIYRYSTYASDYFHRCFINDKDLLPLASNLQEVFNNIFDHSKSENAYVITQYYPNKKQLSFSVCDFGLGIPTTVNNYRVTHEKKKLEDWEALTTALRGGFSIKSSPQNRGLGLNNIRDLTETTNGKLLICSNNAFLIKEAGKNYSLGEIGLNFKGTLIRVDVDTNLFEQMDNEINSFDFW